MRCCASETVSAGHVRMLFSGFPGALFLCDPIASGAFRGLLPSESLFVILANTRSIFDITSWREIGSAVMAPLPVELGVCRTHRSLEVRSSLRCARACGRTSRVGSTKVMRGLLPWSRWLVSIAHAHSESLACRLVSRWREIRNRPCPEQACLRSEPVRGVVAGRRPTNTVIDCGLRRARRWGSQHRLPLPPPAVSLPCSCLIL